MDSIYGHVMSSPSQSFQEVRDGRRTQPESFDVDMSVARSIAAGTHLVLNIAGNFFYADQDPNSQGAATVRFQDAATLGNAAAPIYIPPGFVLRTAFTSIIIENKAQPGKIFRVIYGTDLDMLPGGSNQVNATIVGTPSVNINQTTSYGYVAVSQTQEAYSRAGISFVGRGYQPATAGQNSYVGLWNPAASGKTILLRRARLVNGATASQLVLAMINGSIAAGSGSSINGPYKRGTFAGGGSVAVIQATFGAPSPGNTFGVTETIGANGGILIDWTNQPLSIAPATGFLAAAVVVNNTLDGSFEWDEV